MGFEENMFPNQTSDLDAAQEAERHHLTYCSGCRTNDPSALCNHRVLSRSAISSSSFQKKRYAVLQWTYEIAERLYPDRAINRPVFQGGAVILDQVIQLEQRPQTVSDNFPFRVPITLETLQLYGVICFFLAIERFYKESITNGNGNNNNSDTVGPTDRVGSINSNYMETVRKSVFAFIKDIFSDADIIKVEMDVRSALQPTLLNGDQRLLVPYSWFKRLFDVCPERSYGNVQAVRNLALALLDSHILELSTTKHKLEWIAAGSLIASRRLYLKSDELKWTNELEQHTQIPIEAIQKVYQEMIYVAKDMFQYVDKQPSPHEAQV